MTAATVDNTGAATMAATMMDPSSVGTGTSDTASIDTTGPNSYNDVSSKTTVDTTVDNTNDIAVTNENTQSASSGKAECPITQLGGSATSGDASNTSSTTTTLMVSN